MDIRTAKNTFSFIKSFMDKNNSIQPVVKTKFIHKRAYDITLKNSSFYLSGKSSVPQNELLSYLIELSKSEPSIHTISIYRNNECLLEKTYKPYEYHVWNDGFSLCKTITGLAVGMLIDDGLLTLDDSMLSFFDLSEDKINKHKLKEIKIRHLLTMSSGIGFRESGMLTSDNWIESILNSHLLFEPGTRFQYNSMNSYILSYIVCKVAGMSLTDFLKQRLFEPLSILHYDWERNSQQIEKGGWGLFITPIDMVKIGSLILNNGMYQNQQIVSSSFIKQATAIHQHTTEEFGDFDYGFHIWIERNNRVILLNGMCGQNVYIIPEKSIIITVTAGNEDAFQTGSFFTVSKKYFLDRDIQSHKSQKVSSYLIDKYLINDSIPKYTIRNLYYLSKYKKQITNNQIFYFNIQQTKKASVIPFLFQLVHNCFSKGLI